MIKDDFTSGWTSDNYNTWNNMDQAGRINLANQYFNTLFAGNPMAAQNAVAQFVNETGNYGNLYAQPTTSYNTSNDNTNASAQIDTFKNAVENAAPENANTNTTSGNTASGNTTPDNTTSGNMALGNTTSMETKPDNTASGNTTSMPATSMPEKAAMTPSRSNSGRNNSSNPMLNNNDNREVLAKQTNKGINSGNVMSFGVSDENEKTISSNILKTNRFGLLKRK
jgi:hypothetical protein